MWILLARLNLRIRTKDSFSHITEPIHLKLAQIMYKYIINNIQYPYRSLTTIYLLCSYKFEKSLKTRFTVFFFCPFPMGSDYEYYIWFNYKLSWYTLLIHICRSGCFRPDKILFSILLYQNTTWFVQIMYKYTSNNIYYHMRSWITN